MAPTRTRAFVTPDPNSNIEAMIANKATMTTFSMTSSLNQATAIDAGASPAASRRAAVDFEQPQSAAACRTVSPDAASVTSAIRGRPSRFPGRFARASPAWTRSTMRAFSKTGVASVA